MWKNSPKTDIDEILFNPYSAFFSFTFYAQAFLLCFSFMFYLICLILYFVNLPPSQYFIFIFLFKFIYFNWRLITLQYCIGFAIHQHESSAIFYILYFLKGTCNRTVYGCITSLNKHFMYI